MSLGEEEREKEALAREEAEAAGSEAAGIGGNVQHDSEDPDNVPSSPEEPEGSQYGEADEEIKPD